MSISRRKFVSTAATAGAGLLSAGGVAVGDSLTLYHRVVTRDGRSLGDRLVAEGLARTWTGRRQPWC